jgi:hypothetical protein
LRDLSLGVGGATGDADISGERLLRGKRPHDPAIHAFAICCGLILRSAALPRVSKGESACTLRVLPATIFATRLWLSGHDFATQAP